jgi:hypothetical protein
MIPERFPSLASSVAGIGALPAMLRSSLLCRLVGLLEVNPEDRLWFRRPTKLPSGGGDAARGVELVALKREWLSGLKFRPSEANE